MERGCEEGEPLVGFGQHLHGISKVLNFISTGFNEDEFTDSASCQSRSHCVCVVDEGRASMKWFCSESPLGSFGISASRRLGNIGTPNNWLNMEFAKLSHKLRSRCQESSTAPAVSGSERERTAFRSPWRVRDEPWKGIRRRKMISTRKCCF